MQRQFNTRWSRFGKGLAVLLSFLYFSNCYLPTKQEEVWDPTTKTAQSNLHLDRKDIGTVKLWSLLKSGIIDDRSELIFARNLLNQVYDDNISDDETLDEFVGTYTLHLRYVENEKNPEKSSYELTITQKRDDQPLRRVTFFDEAYDGLVFDVRVHKTSHYVKDKDGLEKIVVFDGKDTHTLHHWDEDDTHHFTALQDVIESNEKGIGTYLKKKVLETKRDGIHRVVVSSPKEEKGYFAKKFDTFKNYFGINKEENKKE